MTPEVSLLRHPAPRPDAARKLLVMLPGAGMAAEDFAAHGFVRALNQRCPDVDSLAARVPLELYLDGNSAAALHQTVIEPARTEGYVQIWLLGISLGGMGALLYAALHENLVDGIVLLAPFLGTPGTIAGIEAAGGLRCWTPNAATTAPEANMLLWLKDFTDRPPPRPKLFLGYGEADRFARGHRLLAALLPPERMVTRPGRHDWETWAALWRRLLDGEGISKQGVLF